MENLRLLSYLQYAGTIFILVIYITGVVISGILIRRGARQGGMLTLLGFALLMTGNLCSWVVNLLLFPRAAQGLLGPAHFLFIGLNSLMSIVGLILIILGVWHLGIRSLGVPPISMLDSSLIEPDPPPGEPDRSEE